MLAHQHLQPSSLFHSAIQNNQKALKPQKLQLILYGNIAVHPPLKMFVLEKESINVSLIMDPH
jgi:hypothetical protein